MTILMYHKVSLTSPTIWWVSADEFYRQMLELKSRNVVYLDDYNPSDPNQVVITFDGIYKNVLQYAAPILREFNYPFELFLSSDYIGKDNSFDTGEPLAEFVTLEDLNLLVAMNGRLQWKTKSNSDLNKEQEVYEIISEIEIPLNLKVIDKKGFKWVAYPSGNFHQNIIKEVSKKFTGAVSLTQGNATNIYCLNRIAVTNESTFKKATTAVVISAYNQSSFLVEAIESVLRQTKMPDEIIISDDASEDNTHEIADAYQKKYPYLIKVNRNSENLGIVENFNKAVKLTNSDYISILNGDDRYRSDFIEKTSLLLDQYSDVGIAYSDFALFGTRAKIAYDSFPVNRRGLVKLDKFFIINFPDFDEDTKDQLLTEGNFIHGASLFRRQAFDEVGGYVYQTTIPEDYYLFSRIVRQGWNAKRVPYPILEYRQYSKSQTNTRLATFAELQFYKQLTQNLHQEIQQLKWQLQVTKTANSIIQIEDNFTASASLSEQIEYPAIPKLVTEIDRPFWSVMIPVYNNTEYLEKTLRCVLDQAPALEIMQIEVVDDCSTQGDVEEIVQRVGKGRVSFYRQPKNLGLIGSWNACIERARGYWVHILHQDDLVMPGFYAKLQVGLENHPHIGAAFCRHLFIDALGNQTAISYLERETSGILNNWLELIAGECRLQCASIVVNRSVYEKLGGFCPQAGYAADWEMWKRIAANYEFWYEPDILAAYRLHSFAATSGYIASGKNIADTRKTIEISKSYLPKNLADKVSSQAREHYAVYAMGIAYKMLNLGKLDIALNQIREGLRCSQSSRVMNAFNALLAQSEILVNVLALFLKNSQNNVDLTPLEEKLEEEINYEFSLTEFNLIAFPEWQQPEELLYEELASLIKSIITHPETGKITLLLDNSGISEEDANFIISDIVFNLLQAEDLEVDEEPQISLVGNLSQRQWENLLPHVYSRILLTRENRQAILEAKAEHLHVCHFEGLAEIKTIDSNVLTSSPKQKSEQRINIASSLGSKPKIDVVLHATGLHGWSCSRGWVNVLQKEGLLNRVFAPVADWGANEPKYDDGLFEYLNNPQADIMLLLGFDWHSQPLHNSLKWQEQWSQASIIKLAFIQECYSSKLIENTPQWEQLLHHAISSTIPCVDGLICNHEPDVQLLQSKKNISLPITFLPFGVDTEHFQIKTPFESRLNRAVFRGNIAPYFTEKTYSDRRQFLQALSNSQNVDLFQFQMAYLADPSAELNRYVDELNTYRLLLNLPSMSPTLTARPFEIMACGGVLLQNKVIGAQSNAFFQDWENVVYYDPVNPDDLINKINYLVQNPEIAQKIAAQGHQLCYEQHTLSHRIASILDWVGNTFETKVNTSLSATLP